METVKARCEGATGIEGGMSDRQVTRPGKEGRKSAV